MTALNTTPQHLLPPPPPVSFEEWLALPKEELATLVERYQLVMFYSIDGSQRHYYLSHPHAGGSLANFREYAEHTASAYTRVYDLLFSLGIHTVMTPLLVDDNFKRGHAYLDKAISASQLLLLQAPFTDLYTRWKVSARLYGDYELSKLAAPVRGKITHIHTSLTTLTPGGERCLLFGYQAGPLLEELLTRTAVLTKKQGHAPTIEELHAEWMGDGPADIDLIVTSGWVVNGGLVPALYAHKPISYYGLNFLSLDIQEIHLRKILYDHLYLRSAAPTDGMRYTAQDLEALGRYYQLHQNCLVGTGELVGPGGVWYAEHQHSAV